MRYNIIIETDEEDVGSIIRNKFKFDFKFRIIDVENIKTTRTTLQNRSLHKYFSLLAEELNDAGYDMRKTIKQEIDIAWSGMSVKEYLWRPIQKVYLQEQSTTKLKTGDIDKIYLILDKTISERTGVTIPFPSFDNLTNIDYN